VSNSAYRVEIKRAVQKSIARLPRNVQERLSYAMRQLGENPRPRGCIQLKGQQDGFYRIRVGDWRIIYTIEDDILLVVVVQVGPRGDVYESL
jgi:mRNA interferase RelE/StbE